MNKSEKYSEIILLGQMLQERKIEHEQHDLYDGYQIIVPLDRFKDTYRQSRR